MGKSMAYDQPHILSYYLRDADKRKQHAEKKKLSLGDQGSVISEDTAKESHVEGKDGDSENHKIIRKGRRKSKLHESENYSSSLLPKVQNSKLGNHSISNYPTQTFGSTSFPKLHTNSKHQQSMLPSIANTHYNKHHHTTKSFQPAASKNVYGHFQLPSIQKSKEAQF